MAIASQMKPVAPPVYRPQRAASQMKPVAPPVYRPQPAASQSKSSAPPVYRPLPGISQRQVATARTRPALAIQPARGVFLLSRMNAIQRSDSDDDYTEPERGKKQERFNFLGKTPENVIRQTAHQVVHYDATRFQAVWTCPTCQRMLAYVDMANTFQLTQYGYLSSNNNQKSQRALELDHYPPWADRLAALDKQGASKAEKRSDYQDESRLRALCRTCNGSHSHEYTNKLPDYDSDEEDFDPRRTPKHETQYNSGQFSGYRPVGYV
jgi:hypothetical protein